MLSALPSEPERQPWAGLAEVMTVAQALRELPRADFKTALRTELQRRTAMNEGSAASPASGARSVHFVRPGFNNIAPYILVQGAARFIDFLVSGLEGKERFRVPRPDGLIMHAEVSVGDSVIEVADANDAYAARPTAIHLYVADADATYERAVKAGATPVHAVSDQPWGDRQGTVRDPFGNVWYIGMPKGWTPGPEGLRSVQPFLHLRDAHTMIPFVEAAFGGEDSGVATSPEGKVLHATIQIGYATIELNEAHGQVMPAYLHVYFPDVDAVYAAALRAGAVSVEAPADKGYGDRSAIVTDPFGNTWFLATYVGPATV
jgi:PhnB protein